MKVAFDMKMSNQGSGAWLIQVGGSLNESAQFSEFPTDFHAARSITIHLKEISYINSVGILEWLRFVTELIQRNPKARLEIQECSEVVVMQISSIKGFLPAHAVITSLEVPFHCESCDRRTSIWIHNGQDFHWGKPVPPMPEVRCPNCKEIIQADVDLKTYLRCLEPR